MNIIKNINQGFTLIELMITVAIVGILAAVALPAYQNYTIRAQITEGLSLASGQKNAVAEYYSNFGVLPFDNQDMDYRGASGKYISRTDISEGKIITTLGNDANSNIRDQFLILKPVEQSEGNLSWTCSSTVAIQYLPSSCVKENAPSYVADTIYFGQYAVTNGQLNYAGNPLNAMKTDLDGTIHFTPPAPYTQLSLAPNGTISMTNGQIGYNYYPDESYQYSTPIVFTNAQGVSETTKVQVFNMIPDTFAQEKTLAQAANNAMGTFSNSRTLADKNNYDTATAALVQQIQQTRDNNGGQFPSGYPQMFIDLLK